MERNERVDAFRVLAIIAVIIIHTQPFEHQDFSSDEHLGVAAILNQASRFAVPFFFAMSGYFWGSKLTESSSALTQCLMPSRRILLTFFAWSIIYLAPTDPSVYQNTDLTGLIKGIYWRILGFTASPMTLLLQGSKNHLWFLASLLCSLFITALLIRIELPRLLAILSIALFVTGLIGKAYADTSIGISSDFNFRNGPFFSLIFFASGYFLQRSPRKIEFFSMGLPLTLFGASLHFAEVAYLHEATQARIGQDYVAGTYFFGMGVALMALNNASTSNLYFLPKLGPSTFGIFLTHFIFIDLLQPIDRHFSGQIGWEITQPVWVFLLSLILTNSLMRSKYTKWLVT